MSKKLIQTSLAAILIGAATISWASDDTDKMNAKKPSIDSETTYHAHRHDGVKLDDGRMNAQLLADELELSEAFSDPELLAELDLDDMDSFEYPVDDEGLLDDR